MSLSEARISELAANVQADAIARLLDGGLLELRSGPPPASVDDPATGDLLATLRFGFPSASRAREGVLVFYPLLPDRDAAGSGDIGHFRACTAGGKAVWDGTVGTADAAMIVSSTFVRRHSRVVVDAAALTFARESV